MSRARDDAESNDLSAADFSATDGIVVTEARLRHSVLTVVEPARTRARTAMLVLPGGSYTDQAIEHEGLQPARWLVERGVTAGVLRYRVALHRHPGPIRNVHSICYVHS